MQLDPKNITRFTLNFAAKVMMLVSICKLSAIKSAGCAALSMIPPTRAAAKKMTSGL